MDDHLSVLIDSRGLSRAIVEAWIPALEPDTVWLVSPSELPDESGPVPVLRKSAEDIGTADVTSADNDDSSVLVVTTDVASLSGAHRHGLHPCLVKITCLESGGQRFAPQVQLSDADRCGLIQLIEAGFRVEICALPNTTPRALDVAQLSTPAESEG